MNNHNIAFLTNFQPNISKFTMKVWLLHLLVLILMPSPFSQELPITKTTDSSSMRHLWRAYWITHPTALPCAYGVYHFRRTFKLANKPSSLNIYISADNRYRLFVNDIAVCEGPARDDLSHWPYDTIDIAPMLQAGENIIAARVINFGEHKSGGQFSEQTAFILQSDNLPEIDTNHEWKVMLNKGVRANPITPESFEEYYQVLGFYAGGPCDSLYADQYPWEWSKADYDDSDWFNALQIRLGAGRGFPYGNTWFLMPRQIDMLEEIPKRIKGIERTSGIDVPEKFLTGEESVTIPAHSTVSILCDNNVLTMGYPQLKFSGGALSTIKMTYAESLFDKRFLKGDRNESKNKKIYGIYDIIKPDGGKSRMFQPTWIRAFRYLQLDITTAREPLTLQSLTHIFTAYPLKERAQFDSDDSSLTQIWDASWRSLRLCARETYFSDAYFEQMQYIGDTRVQNLATLVASGEGSLFKNALRQFDASRVPIGLTQSRYPARELQIIPTYSLLYIAMIHDYLYYQDDCEFVKSLVPGITSILDWFESKIDETGLLTNLDWWNFCDWAQEYPVGIPPGADDGYSTLIALHYIYALQKAADIYTFFGDEIQREACLEKALRTQEAIRQFCYDENRRLYAETPERRQFSQHTNIFAILTDTHPKEDQKVLMKLVLEDQSLIQTTFYFKFYLFEALFHCGMGDFYSEQLAPWRQFINLGLTTFPEDNSERPRSDCHPWSGSPCYHFLSLIAGIRPSAPGFRSVSIAPSLGPLHSLNVTYPHAKGDLVLEVKRVKEHGLRGTVSIPEGLDDSKFIWAGKTIELKSGEQSIHFSPAE